ncbi:MAG: DUF2314 domain-containing protein [Planctomycetes bacterium]|nr:DUF2314 domain-containing protein [Planctomycetota bacterium]
MMEHERESHEETEQEGPEPCALLGLWPEPECPNEEEVRSALEAVYGSIQEAHELEGTTESPWCKAFEIPGLSAPVMVWTEERGDLSDAFVESWIDDESERKTASNCRWLLGVETVLDAQGPARSYHQLLRVLVTACVPGLPAVYDDGALCLLPGRRVRDMASASVAPRSSALFAIHTLPGRGGNWIHTHGLSRAGIPELELLCVPADDQGEATDLLEAAADALLNGAEPTNEGLLQLGDEVAVRLMGAAEALPLLAEDCAGGLKDRGEHPTNSWVLLDPDSVGTPRTAISRMASDVVLYKSADETKRQKEFSHHRFGVFGQLFALRRNIGWQFHVKLAFERASSHEFSEYLWFEALELKPGWIRGKLLSAPRDVPALVAGSESWQPLERLTDWIIVTPEGSYDPETSASLLED